MRLKLKPYRLTFCFIAFFCARILAAESFDAVSLATSLFAKHQFSEGQSVLTARLSDDTLSDAERAAVQGALGDFYCDYVGDYSEGVRFYQRAVELQPDADGFKKKMESVLSLISKNADIDQIILDLKGRANWTINGPDDGKKIARLQQFLTESPDYYRAAEIHYCIALYHADEGREGRAIAGLNRAESIKPAISFYLPLENQREALRARFYRKIVARTSLYLFIGMLVLSAALFFCAKPWRWLTFKTVGYFALVMVVLMGLFLAAGSILSSRYLDSEKVLAMVSIGEHYLYTGIFAHGSQIYFKLLLYMAAAFFITAVFSLGSFALIRRKPVAFVLNGLAGTLIMASLVCIFYLRYCELDTFETPELRPGSFVGTSQAFQFFIKGEGIEPLLLTDPEDFPNPGISHGVNPPLEKWAKEHCPFTKEEKPDAQ